jgi:NAD-dependent deacetylase
MSKLTITDDTFLLVLTGAGVSAESGVPTFRDAGGLWEGHEVTEVATPAGFKRDPLLVWRFYSERRAGMDGIVPNAGHHALAELERRMEGRFLLATQNIDGLHRAAGSERVIEMHGNLMMSRCTVCDRPPFEDRTAYKPGVAPMCGRCKAAGKDALLRPHIVWFNELLDRKHLERIENFCAAAGQRLVFLAIGTSGLVYPAAGLVDAARAVGGTSWLVNAERPANAGSFDHVVIGPSGKVLPDLFTA